MIYSLFGVLIIITVIFIPAYFKKQRAIKAKLVEIKAGWGKPNYENRNFSLISIYLNDCNEPGRLSPGTTADLDLDYVFIYMDRTSSKPGQQYLYKKLHYPELSVAVLQEMDEKAVRLSEDRAKQERIQLELSKLNTRNAYYLPELFAKEQMPLFGALLTFYIRISWIVMLTMIFLLIQAPNQLFFIGLMLFAVTNTAVHYKNKGKIAQYTHSLPQLLILNKVARWLTKNVAVNNNGEVKSSLYNIDKLKRSLTFVNFQNGISADPTDIFSAIFEFIKTIFLLESLMFITSLKQVNKYRQDIEVIYKYVAELDLLIAIESVRIGLPHFVRPEFSSGDGELRITDLYHPLVENCVPNSMYSTPEKGVLVTGSNMSGKTTFIRAIAINSLLAQTIYTCCASAYSSPLLKIHTSIRVSDDVEEHKSYFQAEAISVLDIVNKCGIDEPYRSLVIIDEIFRGTNTIERIAAAKAVLAYLTANRNFVFVSTHDLELAELLGDDYSIYCFEESVADKRLVFDYKIKQGLLKNKNGIAILESIGYPASVVKDAISVSEELRKKYQL